LPEYVNRCYQSSPEVARKYFLVLGEIIQRQRRETNIDLPTLLHLIIYQLGNESYRVRQMALKLLPVIEERYVAFVGCDDVSQDLF